MRKTVLMILATLVMAMALAGTALAGPFDDAMATYNRGDYATALRLFQPLANKGNATAQLYLGIMYYGNEGVPQDYAEALKWFRKAADRGEPHAQSYLAHMYLEGKGVPEDIDEAVKWWRKAADRGEPYSQIQIGHMYRDGKRVPTDYIEAHKWFNLAASRFSANAKFRKTAERNRDETANTMTPAQIAEAQKRAREWKPIVGEVREAEKREADRRALDELKLTQDRARQEAEDRREREVREAEKREAEDRQRREAQQRREQEQRAQLLAAQQAAKNAADRAKAAGGKAFNDYMTRIQAKIRGNVVLPPDIAGDPEGVFSVVQLPTGEIISAEIRKSSGSRAYDDAVLRAILKSSPLPKPDSPDLFQRDLTLKFRPQE